MEQKFNDLAVEHFIQGQQLPVGRKLYGAVTERIVNAVNNYLRGIGHSLHFNV